MHYISSITQSMPSLSSIQNGAIYGALTLPMDITALVIAKRVVMPIFEANMTITDEYSNKVMIATAIVIDIGLTYAAAVSRLLLWPQRS